MSSELGVESSAGRSGGLEVHGFAVRKDSLDENADCLSGESAKSVVKHLDRSN